MHPDIDQLELHRLGEGDPATAAHVAGCESCRATLASLAALANELAPTAIADPPAAIDAAIRAAIHARTVRPMPLWRRPLAWAAAIALLAAGAWIVIAPDPLPAPPAIAGDVNGDGTVNILDALALATRVEAGEVLPRFHDFDRDGVVTRRDADALALRVVQLPRGQH